MDTNNGNQPITYESVLALIQKQSEEFDRRSEEFDRRMILEADERKAQTAEYKVQVAEYEARSERAAAAMWLSIEKTKDEWAKSAADLKQSIKDTKDEWAKSAADLKQSIKENNIISAGISTSLGMFAEEFFRNSIYNGDRVLFGQKFDECIANVKRFDKNSKKRSEQDLMLINGESFAVVEVKFRARLSDIQELLDRVATIRTLYPQYKDHKLYLGLAGMSFEDGVEEAVIEAGIAVVKQVGETIEVIDDNLKVF
jgi:hypothetical protein